MISYGYSDHPDVCETVSEIPMTCCRTQDIYSTGSFALSRIIIWWLPRTISPFVRLLCTADEEERERVILSLFFPEGYLGPGMGKDGCTTGPGY